MNTNNDAFLQHYGKFYGKAEAVLFSLNEKNQKLPVEELSKQSQTASTVISTFHRLLFGLDENQKSKAVSYKNGALETVLQLATAIEQSEETVLETLKTIKCCVVRCASGRNRCRSAGVFSYLQSRLDKNETNEVLMSEALTVLAAISLNNDLNALQVSLHMCGKLPFQIYVKVLSKGTILLHFVQFIYNEWQKIDQSSAEEFN